MDVVHQNDAAAFRIQPPHGALHNRFWGAAAPPIVRVDVHAPGDKLLALQEPFNRIGAAEVRNAEEGRERFGVAERGRDRTDAAVDLALNPPHRQALEMWVVLAVSADGMAFVVNAPDDRRIATRHLAD